jgi:alanyl-tRNA synthetase
MTDRLYYRDSYLREFAARVTRTSPDGTTVYLDRTAFYPTSGGQPCDTGLLGGAPVIEVIDEGENIAHQLASPVGLGEAACVIDWPRRFDHMQQHTGQHLLSAVFEELLGLHTVSFHLGQQSSTIDLESCGLESPSLDVGQVRELERRANQVLFENREVSVQFADAAEATGLRKPSEREGELRIITIDGLDRSACGGTHVRATGEIGPILIRKLDKVRQSVRVEFLCGGRAVRRARADYEALVRIAQLFSAPPDETPALVSAQLENARAVEKSLRKAQVELAEFRGRQLYESTPPDADGIRRRTERAASIRGSAEECSALARSFTAQPKAVYVAVLENPPSVIYAVSADSGIHAAEAIKQALTAVGGRGGGNAQLAQGSVPEPALLETVMRKLAMG